MIYCIIVTYNGQPWIEACLNSLRLSTVKPVVMVLDNASTDATCDIIASRFPETELIKLRHNMGFGGANNLGIKMAIRAGADYVFLLNQDTTIYPDTLEKLLKVYDASAEKLGVLSPMHLNDTGDALDKMFESYITSRSCPGYISDVTLNTVKSYYKTGFVNAAAWLVKAEVFTAVGLFSDAFFHYGEDSNFLQRLSFHGYFCAIVPGAAIHHFRQERDGKYTAAHLKRQNEVSYTICMLNIKKSYAACYKDVLKMGLQQIAKKNSTGFSLLLKPVLQMRKLKKIRNTFRNEPTAR